SATRLLQPRPRPLIHRIHTAPLQPPRPQRPTRVQDDPPRVRARPPRVLPEPPLVAAARAAVARARGGAGHAPAVPHAQIRADQHAHVVELEALAGVDAADLVDRLRMREPAAPVLREVPAHAEVVLGQLDVPRARVLLAPPVPAVARHHARAAPCPVALTHEVAHLGG